LLLGQVITERRGRRLVSVTRRAVVGTLAQIAARLAETGTGTQIHTAYIERLNSTFRCSWAHLTRRSRSLADQEATLVAGMYLVGTVYNLCRVQANLRIEQRQGRQRWQERTPAMAAGLTDHPWTLRDLLWYRVPPPAWVARSTAGVLPSSCRPSQGGWQPDHGSVRSYPIVIGPWKSFLLNRDDAFDIQTGNTSSSPGVLKDLGTLVLNSWAVFQWLLTLGEIAVGLGLLLGLLSRLTAIAGFLLAFSTFMFTFGAETWTFDYLFEPAIFVALLLAPALPGLDSRLAWGRRRRVL